MSAVDAKAIVINVGVIDGASGAFKRIGASAQGMGAATNAGMMKAQSGMAKFGAAAAKVAMLGGIAVAVGLALSAKAAVDFESSFAGVRKTVDASEAGFRALADGVRAMAKEIPIGVNELNRIMELGGQLGVDPTNLHGFTETIAEIGVTTTLSTDAAAMGFARLDNIMQTGGQSFDRMGSTIVDLGNNFAATEDEILTFATRIAPMASTVGMITDEVLSIATAFTSVGIPAERGGTAVQKTLIKMSDAAADGGPKLEAFADVAGMTSEAFAELFKEDPAKAFSTFVTGLGDMIERGENTVPVFRAMELQNARTTQSLLAMANADDVLVDALDRGATAWGDNIALTEEAQKRYDTTASALIILKNNIQDAAISIGGELLPAINEFIVGSGAIVDWFSNLPSAVKDATFAIGGFLGALALANKHPIVLGILAVAAAVREIGIQSIAAQERWDDLKIALQLDDPEDTAAIRERLLKALGEGFGGQSDELEDLENLGYTPEQIWEALTGSDADWAAFTKEANSKYEALFGVTEDVLSTGIDALDDAVSQGTDLDSLPLNTFQRYRNEIKGVRKEIESEQRALDDIKKRQRSDDRKYRYGGRPEGIELTPAVIKPEHLDDVADAFDDHADRLADSFSDISDSVWDYLDLWYEFDDEYEAAFTGALDSFDRQITALGDFEADIRSLKLDNVTENLLRQLVPTPQDMEAWLSLSNEAKNEIIARLSGQGDEITKIIAEKWAFKVEAFEFTSGQQLLADMAAVAAEIEADDTNIYSPVEIWLGLAEAAMAEADSRGIADDVSNWLLDAFSDDGSLLNSVEGTKALIDSLIAKLLELQGDYDVNVRTTFTQSGHAPEGQYTNQSSAKPSEIGHSAFGGNILGGTPTIVGEYGKELFVPFNSGTIIPNSKLKGEQNTEYNLTIHGSTRPDADAQTALLAAHLIGGM